MKEKIKLGIPIENGETGETNIILRTNEIRIIEEAFEENERLHSIIKEVREYIENNSIYYPTSDGCQWVDQFKVLEILKGSDK